ncbi:MAG TPA: hypothetical protein VFG45_08760 [Candidatus Nitrosocosmicus sp.]|nr:hypothetical protein [Candidatus Nitrosocosmicus sp.]
MTSKYGVLFILLLFLTISWSTITSLSTIGSALAQSSNATKASFFHINVQVSNNANTNLVGSIHVMSASTGAVKNANDITFPAGQTVIKIFEFSQSEIPKGTEFIVEVVYSDDYSIRAYGVNNHYENVPQFFNMNIP